MGRVRRGDTEAVSMEDLKDSAPTPKRAVGVQASGRTSSWVAESPPHVGPLVSIFISLGWKHTIYLHLLLTEAP